MATVYWNPNAALIAQIDTLTVTVAANGGTISCTINGKSITYTMTAGDTTSTAAAALQALLVASTVPPEFQEMTFATAVANAFTATSNTAGTPFTLTVSSGGGATITITHTQANVSNSDVGLAANWLRSGVAAIPVNGDDVVINNSAVPMLWNLTALAAVQFNSLTRYNSMTGQIGLPYYNPNGYVEYRPTYFQFTTAGGAVNVVIGLGPGSGPPLEKYNGLAAQYVWNIAGASQVYILNTSAASTFQVNASTVNIAMLPGEVATCSGGVTAVNGSTVYIGSGVTFSGELDIFSASVAFLSVAPTTIKMNNGSLTMNATGGTVTTFTAYQSQITWNSTTTITTYTATFNSTLTAAGDASKFTITNSNLDGSCQVLDPWNNITWTNATTMTSPVGSGPFTFGTGRTVKVT